MVRLGKTFAGALLAAAAILLPSAATSQATTPSQLAPPANSASQGPTSPQVPPAHGTIYQLQPETSKPAFAPASPAATSRAAAAPALPAATSKPASVAAPQAARPHSRRSKNTPVAETAPTAPPPPPTLEQSPPTAPRVTLQNALLTIDASNSTLAQILHAVQARTGASIDVPASAGNDRVVGQFGPGLPRDVLNTLLNGSKFDYVILGVTGDPGGIQKVILTPRQAGTAVNTAQNNNSPPAQEEDAGDEGVPVADTSENEYPNPEQPAPPQPGGFRRPIMPGGQPPGFQQQGFQQGDPGAQGNGEQQNGTKTPEQLMQEMQQLQQQQQQYQQQLNPANQQPQ